MAMQSSNDAPQLIPLSSLDNIMPLAYTRIILCIQTEKNAEHSAVTALLRTGLRKTVEQVPFLAGEVVPYTTNKDRLGRFAVSISQPDRLQLQTKDLTKKKQPSDSPEVDWKWSFEDLAQENWLLERFDGDILAPTGVFPDPFEDAPPVMEAQVNFIEGGLLLCAAFHHRVMDGIGVGTIIRLWAQNCREIENAEIHAANENPTAAAPPSAIIITPEALDRTPVTSNSMADENGSPVSLRAREHPEYDVVPPSTMPIAMPVDTFLETQLFYFSGDALARLKNAAKGDVPAKIPAKSHGDNVATEEEFHGQEATPTPWISTNDAICALLWSCITRARSRPGSVTFTVDSQQSKLGMANNGRRKLQPPLPDTYIGNVNLYSLAVLPTAVLTSETALPYVAQSVRTSVNKIDAEHIRSAVRFIDALPDIAVLRPSFRSFLGPDLAITSWAELGLNGLHWGRAVGTVQRVRLPAFLVDGLCIVLPRTTEGALEVLVGLSVDAMRALTKDDFFTSFSHVQGPSPSPHT